jgi:hypothetical protein
MNEQTQNKWMLGQEILFQPKNELYKRLCIIVQCHRCFCLFPKRKSDVQKYPLRQNFCSHECHNSEQIESVRCNGQKICKRCGHYQDIERFYFRSNKSGRRSICKDCNKKSEIKRLPQKVQSWRLRRSKNPSFFSQREHESSLKTRYGIDKKEYIRLLKLQEYVCAVCLQPETKVIRGKIARLSVDHCHKNGSIRGILCSSCNVFIGLLREDENIMTRAISYLNGKKFIPLSTEAHLCAIDVEYIHLDEARLKRTYGLSAQQYRDLFLLQQGVCAICLRSETRILQNRLTSLVVDHCHERAEVRGLLCSTCNTALGLAKDDPNRIQKAIDYLKRSNDYRNSSNSPLDTFQNGTALPVT